MNCQVEGEIGGGVPLVLVTQSCYSGALSAETCVINRSVAICP